MNQLKLTSTGIVIQNENIAAESFVMKESLCSEDIIRFGSCEASTIKLRIRNTNPVIGKKFNVQLGDTIWKNRVCHVDKRTADRCYRDIELYDAMYDIIQADVTDWYNTILPPDSTATVTLKQFRDSFFNHFSITQKTTTLVNDAIVIARTIAPDLLTGKTVINAICEINGCFGHIADDGKFEYVYLSSNNANVIQSGNIVNGSSDYSDFTTDVIDKIQIRQEENDIGATYGTGNNCYVIQGNFLVYGKDEDALQLIASNVLNVIGSIAYKPFKMRTASNIPLGGYITYQTNNITVNSYVLEKETKGIQSILYSIQAKGQQKQSEKVNSLSEQITQLKGKANVLERNIEETRSEITDVEQGLSSRITQNASSISSEITRATSAENSLNTRITQTESEFTVKVEQLQKEIDGEIKEYNVSEVPTLTNYPAWDFTYNIPCDDTVQLRDNLMFQYTDEYYSKNARSVAFDETTFMTYKFSKGENGQWYWREVAETDFGYVMQRLAELNIEVDEISTTVEENKTWADGEFSSVRTSITQTANSITAEIERAGTAEETLSTRITANTTSITSEVSRARSAEGTLSTRITQTAESITSEVERATSAEGTLSSRITQASDAITSEVARSTQAETNLSSRITQASDSITAEVERATGAEGTLSSRISQNATEISAKVSQTGGASETFGWTLKSDGFVLSSGGTEVFKCNKNGIVVNGYATAAELRAEHVYAEQVNVQLVNTNTIVAQKANTSELNAQKARIDTLYSTYVTADYVNANYASIGSLDAQKARIDTIESNYITASYITADVIQSKFQSPNAGIMTMGTMRAANLYIYDGTSYRRLILGPNNHVTWA